MTSPRATLLQQTEWLIQTARPQLELEPSDADAACTTAWQRSLLRQQRELRHRSRTRFPDPQSWLWTERSLAQASDWWSARFKASMFPAGSASVDACCGAGVDSVALAQRTSVTSIDSDPLMTALASSNACAHGIGLSTRTAKLTLELLRGLAGQAPWLHIDPDRRPADKRTTDADAFSPPLDEVLAFTELFSGAMVKLAPSTRMAERVEQRIAGDCRRVWVGNRGECRQQLLLTGEMAPSPGELRTAVLAEPPPAAAPHAGDGSASVYRFSGRAGDYADCAMEPAAYLVDAHAVLHAAGLQTVWGAEHHLRPLGGEHGYLTGAVACEASPWAQWFVVREVLPWDDRQVRKWLRSVDAGIVEVKNRLVRLDANACQRRLSGSGSNSVCLLVTKLGDRVRAIAAERLQAAAQAT